MRSVASVTTTEADRRHMTAALELARRMLGRTWPNPAVGCVIVRDGRVVGRGSTRAGGRPHAETEALGEAGGAARGATAYVTLEPCAHHGATPPCADALIAAGVARIVVAIPDPDPRTAGQGIARMQAAGISVVQGTCAVEAQELNSGFLMRLARGKPLVTLKVAATLDGRVATASGDSRWITGDRARQQGHMLRSSHDAIVIGSGTALADDPTLTCRLPGLEARSPVRIVVDSGLRTPAGSRLVRSVGAAPLWLVCGSDVPVGRKNDMRRHGVEVIEVHRDDDGRVSLPAMLAALGDRGLTRLLVEGGPTLSTAMLCAGLVDRLAWFSAPSLIGADGLPAIGDLGARKLSDCLRLWPMRATRLDSDTMLAFKVPDRFGG